MHAVQHSRTREERSQNGQAESRNQQRQVPYAQHPTAFLHQHRVNICSSGNPRKQRCVFNRVPCPHATPAQHFIAPPRTKHNADCEEAPRKQCPTSCCEQPTFAHSPSYQRSNCKRKRHGHTHVSQIQQRWVEHDEQVVLQQRVRARPVKHSCWAGSKRVRWTKRKHEEKHRHDEHDAKRITRQHIVHLFTQPKGHRECVASEDKHPHQNGTFERTPHRCKVVQGGRRNTAYLLYVSKREISIDHGAFHHGKRTKTCRKYQNRKARNKFCYRLISLACTRDCGNRAEQ